MHNLDQIRDCSIDSPGCRNGAVSIEEAIVHSRFMAMRIYSNDIALLRLSRRVQFTPYVKPICLPDREAPNGTYWTVGWGQTDNSARSSVKEKVSLPFFNFDECARRFKLKNVQLGEGQICAGGLDGKDSCKGDSGGPLMKIEYNEMSMSKWIIDGIISMGNMPCGQAGWPAVHTKVYSYTSWIMDFLRP